MKYLIAIFLLVSGVFIGRYFFSLPPRVVTNTIEHTRTVTQAVPPNDYGALKGQVIDLRAQLDLARKDNHPITNKRLNTVLVGDSVSAWLNTGAYDAYVTRRACGRQ